MALLLFARERLGELPEDNSLSVGVSMLLGTTGSFLLLRAVGCLSLFLSCSHFLQDRAFFLLEPVNDRSPNADVQRDPAIPSSIFSTPPASSPCLDANEEDGLQATGSLGCWSLPLCQTNHMWGGESSELLVVKGYWIVVGAKPLHVVDETFCSIPTNDANYRNLDLLTSGTSVVRCKSTKRGFDDGVPTVEVAYLSLVGSLHFILEFLLDYGKDNLVILVIRSFFPYQGLILPY